MKVRIWIAALSSMLILAPAQAQRAPGWEHEPALHGLDTAHADRERLHERWLPEFEVNWQQQRERVVDMLCDLGVIALALVECSWATATAEILPPEPVALEQLSDRSPAPEVEDLRRRPLEARMQSI